MHLRLTQLVLHNLVYYRDFKNDTFFYDLHQYIGDDERGVPHFEVFEFTVPIKFMFGKELNMEEKATMFITPIKHSLSMNTLISKGVQALQNNIKN